MSISNVDLPVPAANGAGASQDVSALGPVRTIAVGGDYEGVVHVQVSNEAVVSAPGWITVASFQTGGGSKVVNLAGRFMRAVMAGFAGGTANCDIAGWAQACEFQAMNVPASAGPGTALDVSNMDTFKSVTVGGDVSGLITIEISDDGTSWQPWLGTSKRAVLSGLLPTAQMRVRRANAVGTPIVNVGSGNMEEGGGDNLSIAELLITQQSQDEGTPTAALTVVGGAHTDLDNAATPVVDFDLDSTVNFDGGGAAFNYQAFFVRRGPTLTADAAQTIGIAATQWIVGPPVAGANMTLTERWALYVAGGPGVAVDMPGLNDTAPTDASIGLLLRNATAAAAGEQEWSPLLVLEAQGWKTDAVAATVEAKVALQARTVQGTAAPTVYLAVLANIAGAGYTEVLAITSAGAVLTGDGTAALPAVARSGDPDTGIFFAAGQISGSINAAEHFRVAAAAADQTSIWVMQGSVAALRQVTLAADAGGFRALRVTTA